MGSVEKTLQFSHTCTQALPLLFFDWALLSALPLKTDQNIQSMITEHTWGNHSNGKVMCGNYFKCLSLFSWHLATGNNKNLMWSVCTLQTISYHVPSQQNATAVLALPHFPALILSPVQGANRQRCAAVRVSTSIKDVFKTRQLAKWRHRHSYHFLYLSEPNHGSSGSLQITKFHQQQIIRDVLFPLGLISQFCPIIISA